MGGRNRNLLGCGTCRKRRIKCDEVKPICGQCAIGRRECLEPPKSGLIWVTNKSAGRGAQRPLSGFEQKTVLALNSKRLDQTQGQKLQIAHYTKPAVPLSPPITIADRSRGDFISAFDSGGTGFNLSYLSPYLNTVPAAIGQSKVLDEAVQTLNSVHRSMVLGEQGDRIKPVLYMKALRSLQAALNDPAESGRSTTLCAITILQYAELLGKSGWNMNAVQHAGGASNFLAVRGLACAKDGLGRAMLYSTREYIILNSILGGTECYLSEPTAASLAFEEPQVSVMRQTHNRMLRQLSDMAGYFKDIRVIDPKITSSKEIHRLLGLMLDAKENIWQTFEDLNNRKQHSPAPFIETPSSFNDEEVPIVFDFIDRDTAIEHTFTWAMLIVANSVLIRLHGLLVESGCPPVWSEKTITRLNIEMQDVAQRICQCMEFGFRFAPLGSMYDIFPGIMASSVLPDERKDWIVDHLRKQNQNMSFWSRPVLDYWLRWFTAQPNTISLGPPA